MTRNPMTKYCILLGMYIRVYIKQSQIKDCNVDNIDTFVGVPLRHGDFLKRCMKFRFLGMNVT